MAQSFFTDPQASGWSPQPTHNYNNFSHFDEDQGPPEPISRARLPKNPGKPAKKRRRRDPPVGPAGVWFLAQQQGAQNAYQQAMATQQQQQQQQQEHELAKNAKASTVTANPAWRAMEFHLQRLTPNVSIPSLTVKQRYQRIRPNLPAQYMLLPEVEQGWKMPPEKQLIVLVNSISCHHDDIWTVELQDDTGYTISAWLQPSFVQNEREKYTDPSTATGRQRIKQGYVWCLENCTIMLRHYDLKMTQQDEDTALQRMLIVREDDVTRVWTPNQQKEIKKEEELQWWGRVNTFQLQWDEDNVVESSNPEDQENARDFRRVGNYRVYHGDQEDDEEADEELDAIRDKFYLGDSFGGKSGSTQKEQQQDDDVGDIGLPKCTSLATSRSPKQYMRQAMPPPQNSQVNGNSSSTMGNNAVDKLGGATQQSQRAEVDNPSPPAMGPTRHPEQPVEVHLHPQAPRNAGNPACQPSLSQQITPEEHMDVTTRASLPNPTTLIHQQTPQAAPPQTVVTHSGPKRTINPYGKPKSRRVTMTPGSRPPQSSQSLPPSGVNAFGPSQQVTPGHSQQSRHPPSQETIMYSSQRSYQQPPSRDGQNRIPRVSFGEFQAPKPKEPDEHSTKQQQPSAIITERPIRSDSTKDTSFANSLMAQFGATAASEAPVAQCQAPKPKEREEHSRKQQPSATVPEKPIRSDSTKDTSFSNSLMAQFGATATSAAAAPPVTKSTNSTFSSPKPTPSQQSNNKKKKKSKVQVSPLSKPNPSSMWKSALEGADLLGLSSDEEEDEKQMTTGSCQAPTQTKTQTQYNNSQTSSPMQSTQEIKTKSAEVATSIFQAACLAGEDLLGLSEDEDD